MAEVVNEADCFFGVRSDVHVDISSEVCESRVDTGVHCELSCAECTEYVLIVLYWVTRIISRFALAHLQVISLTDPCFTSRLADTCGAYPLSSSVSARSGSCGQKDLYSVIFESVTAQMNLQGISN